MASKVNENRSMHDLSVVLPCYRSARIARQSVSELRDFLELGKFTWEIIVVDDGGGDFGSEPLSADDRIRLLVLPANIGKGGAVAAGMLSARGAARIYTDVDLPYDLNLIFVAAELLLERRFHMVIGDRTMPSSQYGSELGFQRRVASRVFSTFVGTIVTGGFFDTQCGLKGLRGDVAEEIFRLTRLTGFAFDVEVVYLGLFYHMDIKRIPVQLRRQELSSVRLVSDSFRMFVDVFRIKYHQLRGYYEDSQLSAIVLEDFRSVAALANVRATSRIV